MRFLKVITYSLYEPLRLVSRGSFEWNSVVAEAGITREDRRLHKCDEGELARALQAQPRFEDPARQAVLWPRCTWPPAPYMQKMQCDWFFCLGMGTGYRSRRPCSKTVHIFLLRVKSSCA
jgi:hypothetical protein